MAHKLSSVSARLFSPRALSGKTAIVTGAGSPGGIGQVTAKLLTSCGARVALVDIVEESAIEGARVVGKGTLGFGLDVRDEKKCKFIASKIHKSFGHLDFLISGAGSAESCFFEDITKEKYDSMMDVHVRGTFNMCKVVVPYLRSRRSGAVVCISSVAAQRGGGLFGGVHYTAAKAGILGLVKGLARELASDGIRVNAVAPGPIDTPNTARSIGADVRQRLIAGIPLGRIGSPEDVANAIVYLCSESSAYVTGTVLDVNGGLHIH